MILTHRFKNFHNNEELLRLCGVGKDLYNQALYAVKSTLAETNKFLSYRKLEALMRTTKNLEGKCNYSLLKAQVSQQCLMKLSDDVSSYIKNVKKWSKCKDSYNGMPNLPNYKPKNGKMMLTYTNQCCSISNGRLNLARGFSIPIPQWGRVGEYLEKGFNQVRIHPKKDGTTFVEIVYEVEDAVNSNLDYNKFASIDLGIDNLVTLVGDGMRPILYNGKQLKAKNQLFNKVLAQAKSDLEKRNKTKSSKRVWRLCEQRHHQMEDLLHKVSNHIVHTLLQNGIGKLVLGYNEGWKRSTNIGKVNNQKFVQIPYLRLKKMLAYKCAKYGIEFIVTEESYTSKCDALAMEPICKHEVYLGKRVKRGLFQSSVGKVINADVNGALNILRKVVGDSQFVTRITNRGWLFQPMKLKDLYALRA